MGAMTNSRRSIADEFESDARMAGDDQTAASKPIQNLVITPVLPRPLAIFCLVANIIFPGSGTIISGFSVFCFEYKKRSCVEMINICVPNVLIGICQLITVLFLLIGWFWSIIWGCALVGHSNNFKKEATAKKIRLTVTPVAVSMKDVG